MGAFWFGLKIGLGIAAGVTIWLVVARLSQVIRAMLRDWRFTRAGFCYENNSNVAGWLTRDPHNDDWILWDDRHHVMLRSADGDTNWRATAETMKQCLALGREYESHQRRSQ
jgi:hypothetical protein